MAAAAVASLATFTGIQIILADDVARAYSLDDPNKLILNGCKASIAEHRGRRAIELSGHPDNFKGVGGVLAIIPDLVFKNGTIEIELAAAPVSGAQEPGFLGLAFHVQVESKKYEYVYLRPKNARIDDQLRRNHCCQYASYPDFDFDRLRKESPGVYESYVDLEAAAWTQMKLDAHGTKMRLFVNDAAQPCLVVNDLKLGEVGGAIALWKDPVTRSFFRNLRVTSSTTP